MEFIFEISTPKLPGNMSPVPESKNHFLRCILYKKIFLFICLADFIIKGNKNSQKDLIFVFWNELIGGSQHCFKKRINRTDLSKYKNWNIKKKK